MRTLLLYHDIFLIPSSVELLQILYNRRNPSLPKIPSLVCLPYCGPILTFKLKQTNFENLEM